MSSVVAFFIGFLAGSIAGIMCICIVSAGKKDEIL